MTTLLDAGPDASDGREPRRGYWDRSAAELRPLLSASGPAVSWHAVGFEGEDPFAGFVDRLPVDMRRVSPKRITEFLAGRYCAERALAGAAAPAGLWLPRGDDRLPVWPRGWIGSISHADGIAVAAVLASGPGRILGLDVERLIGAEQARQIQRLVAAPAELELLASLSAECALTLLFSAKEALYKALHPQVRRVMEFSAARLVAVGDGALSLQLSEHWSADWVRGTVVTVRFLLHDTYVSTAVCEEFVI